MLEITCVWFYASANLAVPRSGWDSGGPPMTARPASEIAADLRAFAAALGTRSSSGLIAEGIALLLEERPGSRYEDESGPCWGDVEVFVGMPDYAVAFALWPWPDGGWYAGVTVIDKGYAVRQDLPAACLPEDFEAKWDVSSGFANGMNAHGINAAEAFQNLQERLDGYAKGLAQPRGDSL